MRPNRAVSFMEIMIVLVILGIMIAVTIPSMKGFYQKNQISAAARELAQVARYARQQAILRNATTEIRLDIDENRYRLELEPESTNRRRSRSSRRDRSQPMERVRYLDAKREEIFFKLVESTTDPFGRDNVAKIRFFKNGAASPSTIVIARDSRQMTIEIAGATGAIRVYEGPPEEKAFFSFSEQEES